MGRSNTLGGKPRRVMNVVECCFHRTETFIYDFVTAPRRFESWCLTSQLANTDEFPFPRIRFYEVQWKGRRFWDLVDRALWKVLPGHDLPIRRALFRIHPELIHAHFGTVGCMVLPYAGRYGLPLLTSFYGYDASSLPRKNGWRHRLQDLFRRGTAFAVEGAAMKARLVVLG